MTKKFLELKQINRMKHYAWELQQQLFAMFKYDGIPFRKEFIEWNLFRLGFVAACNTGEKIMIGSVSGYDFDEYGLPKEGSRASFLTRYGIVYQGIIGKDIIIGYNNSIRTPERGIEFYSEQFSEIDSAIGINVKHSKVSSVPVARNGKVKKAIQEILSKVQLGDYEAIADDNILDQMIDGSKEPFQILHLTQPEQIERVQYLSKLYDDLLRRLWTKYGHSMNSTGKMAQVNEMELEGYESYSKIVPFDMLESRQEFLDACNAAFGTNWTVTFGEAWKHLLQTESPEEESEEPEEPEEQEEEDGQTEDV